MSYNLRKRPNDDSDDDGSFVISDEEEEDYGSILDNYRGPNILSSPEMYSADYYETRDDDLIERMIEKPKNYKKKMKKIREGMVKEFVRLSDILDSKAPESVKASLIVDYDLLIRINYYDPLFSQLNKKIREKLSLYKKTIPVEFSQESILDKIINADIDEGNRKQLYQKYLHMTSLQSDSFEYNSIKNYITYGLRIRNKPNITVDATIKRDAIPDFTKTLKDDLDNALYGQTTAKEEIIDNVLNRIINPDIGNITVLLGEPGVGKTYLVRRLAKLLNYKFYQISLGGQTSPDKIIGSLSVYNSSKPGDIYSAVADMGCNNGIILFDEFDKINKDISNAFLNILDPTQNMEFRDSFLHDLTIDLSKTWFILSMNDISNVDPIIADRLKNIVHFKSYSSDEKKEIFLKHFVPEMKKKYKIEEVIRFDDSVIERLTRGDDSGVRDLKSTTDLIFKRISVLSITKEGYKPSYYIDDWTNITLTKLEKLIGSRKKKDDIPDWMYT